MKRELYQSLLLEAYNGRHEPAASLFGVYPSARALLAAPVNEVVRRTGRARKTVQIALEALGHQPMVLRLKRGIARAEQAGARWVIPEWPEALKSLGDLRWPPGFLYCRGSLVDALPRVAIVGARETDSEGARIARQLAWDFAARGVEVVSGGALGIDAAAHLGALDASGRTLAILGSGILVDYPPHNRSLLKRIRTKGAVLSEYPAERPGLGHQFPARNRIIAALADAVVVVRAKFRSGALITARLARQLKRPLYVSPVPASSPWEGNRSLLQQGVPVIRTVEDCRAIADRFQTNRENAVELPAEFQKILDMLNSSPLYYDEIHNRMQLSHSRLNRILLDLEMKKRIRQLAGNRYVATSSIATRNIQTGE